MQETPRILVIRFSSIGDIVLTTPVVRNLHEQMDPTPEIHFLTKDKFGYLLESNPYITKVHTIEKATAEVIDELKSLNFHYIVDLHRNVRSSMVKRGLNIIDFTFKKYNWEKWLLVNFGKDRMPNLHIVDRYMETLKAFGIENDGKGLDYFIPAGEEVDLAEISPLLSGDYTALALGAAHIGKRIPQQLLHEILENVNGKVALIGGPEDQQTGETLAQAFADKAVNLAGKLSVNGSASVIAQSEMVIAGDTGMMHIAAAFQKPTVSIWGCTSPRFGMYPYLEGNKYVAVEPIGLKKRPCSKLGDRCKYGKEKRCMDHISVDQVMDAITLLRKSS